MAVGSLGWNPALPGKPAPAAGFVDVGPDGGFHPDKWITGGTPVAFALLVKVSPAFRV